MPPYMGYIPQGYQQPTYQPTYQQTPVQGLTGRMVTSREEAMAFPADFSGQPSFLPDLGHGVVYVKKFDTNTGLSNLYEFKISQPDTAPAWAEDINSLSARLDALEKRMEGVSNV